MSNWSSTQLTDLGRALDAKVTAGTTLLSFTKMKLGSGTETAEDIPAMTDLVSPKLVLGISSCAVSASDDTICELISVASSSDVEESFVVRELGVFATDPDVGEILYAVMLDSTPDTMQNENVSSPVTVTYQVNIVSDNASSITAVIDPVGLVTASVLQAHNDSISAHKMAHWYRQNSKAYKVGDIAFSASLPSSFVLECTTAGTTAATEPDFSDATIGATVEDGSVEWRYQPLIGGNMPLGAVLPFLQTSIPDGWLSCENGQLVLRSAYPELWAWVQDNAPLITEAEWQAKAAAQKSVGYYSSGDGSTTFRLPRLVGFMEGTTAANVGKFTAAGVPNITGGTGAFLADYAVAAPSGVFNSGAGSVINALGSGAVTIISNTFDASRSSSLYGASDTVQPESVGMVWCVRAFGAATNQGTVDITALAQMLNLKLSISDAPAVCTPFAFPSGTYVDITSVFSTNGATYTAPADGYIYAAGITTQPGGNIVLQTLSLSTQVQHVTAPGGLSVWLPIKKGNGVVIAVSLATVQQSRFVYAVGEEP